METYIYICPLRHPNLFIFLQNFRITSVLHILDISHFDSIMEKFKCNAFNSMRKKDSRNRIEFTNFSNSIQIFFTCLYTSILNINIYVHILSPYDTPKKC